MPAVIVRADGTRYLHTSLDLPEVLVKEAKRRRLSIAKIAARAMMEEFGISESEL